MNFKDIFKFMKAGAKVKLPSWGGYWYWDAEKKTIMMHTKDGTELDIRETEVVEYTTMNICSDEWIFADETNCEQLGGESSFGFGDAIKYMKRGLKVARKGWNGFVGTSGVQMGWLASQADMLADDWVFAK